MNWLNLAAGGALIGVLASCWSYIRGAAWKLLSLLIQRVELYDDEGYMCTATAVRDYLAANCRRSSVYDRSYQIGSAPRVRDGVWRPVALEIIGRSGYMLFWQGWRPIIYVAASTLKAKPDEANRQFSCLFYIRGTVDGDALLAGAARLRASIVMDDRESGENRLNKRFAVISIPSYDKSIEPNRVSRDVTTNSAASWWRHPRNRPIVAPDDALGHGRRCKLPALDRLVFPAETRRLIEEIRMWHGNRDWYRARGIPWKRGWLLHGQPGSGKSALAGAFAEDLDMPLYTFSLGDLNNFTFLRAWTEMLRHTPCIALFEDIDNVFHGRINIAAGSADAFNLFDRRRSRLDAKKSNKEEDATAETGDAMEDTFFCGRHLTFDCFLNAIDGVSRGDGVFTILTTNHIEHIDEALLDRPGRIDRVIELGPMLRPEKLILAARILDGYPDALEVLERQIASGRDPDETPAQFQERCARIALREFWKQKSQEEPQLPALPPTAEPVLARR